jgi:hypothetical protein
VLDASGAAVVGVRIDLGGATTAVRFTDFTGGYTFHVDPGSYTLSASGDCALRPSSVTLTDVRADVRQDFVATGGGCVTATQSSVVMAGSVLTLRRNDRVFVLTFVNVRRASDHDSALKLLKIIAQEQPSSKETIIAGNPAIEREVLVHTEPSMLPGLALKGTTLQSPGSVIAVTTAIALGDTVLRFENQLRNDSDRATVAWVVAACRNLTPEEIPLLHQPFP